MKTWEDKDRRKSVLLGVTSVLFAELTATVISVGLGPTA